MADSVPNTTQRESWTLTPQERNGQRFIKAGVCILGIVFLVWLLLPEVGPRQATRQQQCRNNLKMIGLALYAYHDAWGSFPPAFVAGKDGKPIYGWRTLILPYLDGLPIYNAYLFDEPWDGPNNSILQEKMGMPVFECPSNSQPFRGQTSYVAVVGPNTAWPGATPAKLDVDFPDGASKTILVVEFADSGIHWMEPSDLNFEGMSFTANDPSRMSISSTHSEKGSWPWSGTVAFVNVLFADGAVKRISVATDAATIRALLTANGGEKVEVPP